VKPTIGQQERLSDRPPRPPEIARSPELAILTALDAVLLVADYALLAEHPELWDQDRPFWRPPPDSVARTADAIISLARRLSDVLTRYRRAIEKHDEDTRSTDVPF